MAHVRHVVADRGYVAVSTNCLDGAGRVGADHVAPGPVERERSRPRAEAGRLEPGPSRSSPWRAATLAL